MTEILESRIAPAAVFYFTDLNNDTVKISSTKGTNMELAGAVTLSNSMKAAMGNPHTLEMLTLDSNFAGASISITAMPSTLKPLGGLGFVNVGEINAAGIDLTSVTVHGDLGQIIVGSTSTTAKGPGLVSLNVQSMGDFGTSTGANATLSRFINGVTSITVAQDVNGVLLRADASGALPTAKIGSVFIGGNLIGGSAADTGEIAAVDGIGSVKIMGSVIGGTATDTGRIATDGAGGIGSVYIGGDLVGGSAQASGVIFTAANLGNVTVKGSVLGGSAITSGGIDGGDIGTVTIRGDLMGTQFSGTSSVDHTAFVRAQTNLLSVNIGGSIISGSEAGGGTLTFSGAIQAGQTLGAVKVLGSIQGTAADGVIISASGFAAPTKKSQDVAIKSVSVAGSVTFGMIEGGYNLVGGSYGGDAQIGSVAVGGNLIASDIIAGIKTISTNPDGSPGFGSTNDSLIDTHGAVETPTVAVDADGIFASIASVVVGGQIEGTTTSGDMFGIEAQLIGSIKTGGVSLPVSKGTGLVNEESDYGFYISGTDTSGTMQNEVHIREFAGS